MDAVKYWNIRRRVFAKIGSSDQSCEDISCGACAREFGLAEGTQCFKVIERTETKKAVAILEKWDAENPLFTNARKFEEEFGYSPVDRYGNYLCPPLGVTPLCGTSGAPRCTECSTEWWEKEYVAPDMGCPVLEEEDAD